MRRATADDLPRLLAMGRQFHAASGVSCPFDPDAVAAVLANMIGSENSCLIVSEAGAIGGMLAPAYCARSWTMAIEMFWWAERAGLHLLRAFEDWAREKGADEVRMTTLSALPRADLILRRKGYAPVEVSYTKVIR